MLRRISTIPAPELERTLLSQMAKPDRSGHYRAAILDMPNRPMLGFTEKGVIEFSNQAANQIFGCESDELIGLQIDRLFPQSQARLVASYDDSLWSLGSQCDGEQFVARLIIRKFLSSDDCPRFLAIVKTLQHHSLESSALTTLIASINDAATVWDHADRLIQWNDHAAKIYAPISDVLRLGTPFAEFLTCCLDQENRDNENLDRDDSMRESLTRHRIADGSQEEISIVGKRLLVSERKMPGGILLRLETDITEQRFREAELLMSKEKAEASNRSKSTFLANMSHELRTPLNAVIGFSDILKTELLGTIGNPKYIEYATCISDSGAHLLHLVNYILDLSRIEAGRYELRPEPLAPADLIRDVIRLLRISATESELELIETIANDLPRIVVDRRAIRQALLNIISNAIKFTPAGGKVSIFASANENSLLIGITDTGIGIAEKDLPRLGNPFEQAGNAYSRSQPGTGLGLAITKQLIELHGGNLRIESELGSGTTVTITLPLAFTPPESPSMT